jgi:hypothetical protein
METRQPPPDMDVEDSFNKFVEDFGGELISKIFAGKGKRPNNADYFFRNRTIVAELKCLKKNYYNDQQVGDKLNLMINRWIKEGLLRTEHIKGGRFQTGDLPRQCAIEALQVFSVPTKQAVKKANKQIKETKKYFEIPDAKGLLILANDGNYSINPKFMIQILEKLLPNKYTSIDSFIFFTPNMRVYTPQIDQQLNVWVSGRCRPSSNEVEPKYLQEIQQGWISFLEKRTGEIVTQFVYENHKMIDDLKLVK